jgi:hypothetical protein
MARLNVYLVSKGIDKVCIEAANDYECITSSVLNADDKADLLSELLDIITALEPNIEVKFNA